MQRKSPRVWAEVCSLTLPMPKGRRQDRSGAFRPKAKEAEDGKASREPSLPDSIR